jgi:hypothetical protein
MKFHEIEAEYLALGQALEDAETPEDFMAIEDRFGGLDGTLADKVARTLPLIVTLDAEAAATKAEADRLATLAAARARKASALRELVHRVMRAASIDKVATPIGVVAVQANGGKQALVYEPEAVPSEYMRIVPASLVVDSDRLREAVQVRDAIMAKLPDAVDPLPGVRLAPRGTHLRIK